MCDLAGKPLGDLLVVDANQEHGIVALRPGSSGSAPILPNHACATGAQCDRYQIVGRQVADITTTWPRFSGW